MPDGTQPASSLDRLLGQLVSTVGAHEQAILEVRQDVRDMRQDIAAVNARLDRLLEQTASTLQRILLAILGVGGSLLASLIASWLLHLR